MTPAEQAAPWVMGTFLLIALLGTSLTWPDFGWSVVVALFFFWFCIYAWIVNRVVKRWAARELERLER